MEQALLSCTTCGQTFTTDSNGVDKIRFNGVRKHGENYHENERWDFKIETYSYNPE